MRSWLFLGAIPVLLFATQASAEVAGAWRVEGAISGRTFQLDCRFEGAGGTCVDVASGGKRSHRVTSLAATGDQVAWSFATKVMLMNVTMNFSGRASGDRMNGSVRAAGRTGSFTAVRR